MASESDTRSRFKVAFPWFNDDRWAWHYEPVKEGGGAYRVPGARRDAMGDVMIYMPGASAEQFLTVQRWLIQEVNPAREVPATRSVDIAKLGTRAGGHASTMPL